jgi:hypothetical protein
LVSTQVLGRRLIGPLNLAFMIEQQNAIGGGLYGSQKIIQTLFAQDQFSIAVSAHAPSSICDFAPQTPGIGHRLLT